MTDRLEPLRALAAEMRAYDPDSCGDWADTLAAFLAAEDARDKPGDDLQPWMDRYSEAGFSGYTRDVLACGKLLTKRTTPGSWAHGVMCNLVMHLEDVHRWYKGALAQVPAEDAREPASAAQGAQEPIDWRWRPTEDCKTWHYVHGPDRSSVPSHATSVQPVYASPTAPVVTDPDRVIAELAKSEPSAWAWSSGDCRGNYSDGVQKQRPGRGSVMDDETPLYSARQVRAALESALRGEAT